MLTNFRSVERFHRTAERRSPKLETAIPTCESCGRTPARRITVRRHVGLIFFHRFISVTVTSCRPCGRALIRSYTRTTLWQGWWGAISFFFNMFVLGANAYAARRLRAIGDPSLSGDLVSEPPLGFAGVDGRDADEAAAAEKPNRRTSRGVYVVLGFVVIGVAGWAWDASHHDHEGAHGTPATVPRIQTAMQGQFVADDGSSATVAGATCTGHGDPVDGGFTHFDCSLAFDDGTGDEVLVHLLPNDEIFFKSSVGP